MFESRPNPDAEVLTDLTCAARGENQHAYRKIDAATRLLQAWLDRAADHPDRDPNSYAHNALAEIATTLVVSTTSAEHYATLGLELARLPRIRDAFAAGDIDYARARRIALAAADYSDAVADAIQHDALAAAATCTPSELDTALDALLIRTAPDEHAELQVDKTGEKRRVRKRKNGTLSRIQADLSPEEVAAFWQRLHELAATVCPGDPRDQRTLLADAYVAIGHGETTLDCRCVGGVCTADTHRPQTRRTPLIQITIEVATLLGLRAEPAYLEGHGPIDPALARRLAKDATWVPMLTEALALIEPAPDRAPEAESEPDTEQDPEAMAGREPESDTAPEVESELAAPADLDRETAPESHTEPEPEADPAPQAQPESESEPGLESAAELSEQPARQCPTPSLAQFKARGTRHAAGYVPNGACRPANPLNAVVDDAVIRAALAELTAGGDGHGGFTEPPAGALTYRPNAETAALVRARDRHCRFPGCQMPAARCQLDHIVPFDHE
ncbi:MAG TPA: DUF222 domain-containing protein, partial [Aldersonia sp.]